MNLFKLFSIFTVAFIFIYTFYIEPNNLESTFYRKNFGSSNQKIKVAHITDLHTKGLGPLERKLIAQINAQSVDAIFITGDLSNPDGKFDGYLSVLSKLKAPLGVFFVPGNWEYWSPIINIDKLLEKANVTNLKNKIHRLKDGLWLVGFDDAIEGKPDYSLTRKLPEHAIKIALFHSPIYIDTIANKVDLAFAGHSHGGQVRLPFIAPLWTPLGTGQYYFGWYQRGSTQMYVSRGLGNSILPIRFNCRPEVAFIEIEY